MAIASIVAVEITSILRRMNRFKRSPHIEITVVSGTLRVFVRPSPHCLPLLFQAGIIVIFASLSLRSWGKMPLFGRILVSAAVLGGIAGWFEQLFGFSETIEFDRKHLRIRREIFGWERTREYLIQECSDLEVQDMSGNPHGLQCRLGWRTIEFGDDLSEHQAIEVLSALRDALPEMVPMLFPSVDISKHFTRLGLG